MRKMFILVLILFLFGCQLYLKEENSNEFKELKMIYNSYIEKDIYEEQNYFDFINQATLENISATVKIKNSKQEFSGVIFEKENNNYYVLTLAENTFDEFIIYDYKNIKFRSEVVSFAEKSGFMILKFESVANYFVVEFNDRELFMNEPVISTGFLDNILNNMKLGLISGINNNEISINFMDDYFSIGAPVFNSELKLIGLQKEVKANQIIVLTFNDAYDLFRGVNYE